VSPGLTRLSPGLTRLSVRSPPRLSALSPPRLGAGFLSVFFLESGPRMSLCLSPGEVGFLVFIPSEVADLSLPEPEPPFSKFVKEY